MIETKQWVREQLKARYAGFDRIIGMVTWLLLVLVALEIRLLAMERRGALLLTSCGALLACYRLLARRFLRIGKLKGALDLGLLLFFVVAICWYTGKTASPFLSIVYLILMASSLALGRGVTYLLAGCAVASYAMLASGQPASFTAPLAGRLVELFPFLLIAHLGALLSGEADTARAEVERLSLTDDLTDLNNMRSFETLALQQERLSKRYGKPFAICMLDADNLKQVNDRYGHLAGTELIKWTARIIRRNIRESDVAARFGGDEFIILYSDHERQQIQPAVQRIVQAMAASPFSFEGHLITSTLSAGIASYPADGTDLRTVVKRADEAMYLSKRLGKNRVTVSGAGELAAGGELLQVGGE
jgi:diguanylate cyclase